MTKLINEDVVAWEQLYSEIMARPSSQACVRVCVWICVYAPTPYTSTHVGNCLLTTNLEAAKTQARSLPPSIARGKTFRLPRPGKPWTTAIQHLPVLVERVRTRDKRARALASLAHTESLSPTQMQLERIIQLSKRYEKKEMRQMTRVDEELSSALLVCACACVHMRVHVCICLLRGEKGSNVFASPRTPAIQHLPVWWGASGRGSSAHARLRGLV